jgi:signal transduction histidine kinase
MNRLSPNVTLSLLLCAAVALLLAGIGFSRREQTIQLARDREPLHRFAGDFQQELHRLERLYESHLARIARTSPLDDKQGIWRLCDRVVGVRQFSVLQPEADCAFDLHLAIEHPRGRPWPEPAFTEPHDGLPRSQVLLSKADLFGGSEDSGWIDEPGKPLLFWLRRTPSACVVLMIAPESVSEAIDGWFRDWGDAFFAPVRVTGGPDQVQSPSGRLLADADSHQNGPPDFLLPLRTRFGAWQLASWDPREVRVTYQIPVMLGGAVAAAAVAMIGFAGAAQQRRAMRSSEQRVSFVNAVSHELRAPLTNILLNIELAAEGVGDGAAEPVQRLALVEEEARRLSRLVDNILTFSRREKDEARSSPRACVPASVVRGVLAQFAPSFTRHGLSVRSTGEIEEPCLLDADGLAQILGNLLSNVEKYVPGGSVEIASYLERGVFRLTITDEGPGIPESEAERIFQPFERLDVRITQGVGGAGLGLAIARDLATRMGGSLRLVPSTRGASFELRVPAPLAAAPHSVSAA